MFRLGGFFDRCFFTAVEMNVELASAESASAGAGGLKWTVIDAFSLPALLRSLAYLDDRRKNERRGALRAGGARGMCQHDFRLLASFDPTFVAIVPCACSSRLPAPGVSTSRMRLPSLAMLDLSPSSGETLADNEKPLWSEFTPGAAGSARGCLQGRPRRRRICVGVAEDQIRTLRRRTQPSSRRRERRVGQRRAFGSRLRSW